MFIDTGTLIAIGIALTSQMIMNFILFRQAYQSEQKYHNIVRLLKIERAARR